MITPAPDRNTPFGKLDVSLGERSYPILIGDQLLSQGCDQFDALVSGRQVAIVSNLSVFELHGAPVRAQCAIGASEVIEITLPDGEEHKGWPALNQIFDALLHARYDRKCLLIALGGGVIGDMAGLAAALYQRGVDFVQVPTTLLAQVDSSVGGKTAINHPSGKNMIGAFHQPRLVLADVSTLRTLPDRELSAGLAEMLKHGVIADPAYLSALESGMDRLRSCEAAELAGAVMRSCEIKAHVVAADEREAGVRATLNFGHTFAHAIEAGLGYGRWLHGEAVAAGMVMAANLSERAGYIDSDVTNRITAAIKSAGLPVSGPRWSADRYLELMAVDKKASRGIPRFVLLDKLGSARLASAGEVDEGLVRATLLACATIDEVAESL